MDLSLWDAPIYEGEISDFGRNSESEFYYDFGRDVIEEDAINKTCCIQVLNRLIPMVETDTEELEQETMLLHGELAWTDDSWSNICTSTLRERINKLDMSNQSLKNEKAHLEPALDLSFQTHGEPPPELSDIINSLLSNYAPNGDEQNASSNTEKVATSQSNGENNMNKLESIAYVAKSLEETIEPLSQEAQKRDVKEKDQNGDTTSTESTTNISEHATDLSTKRKIDEINSGIDMRQGMGTHDSDTKAKRMHTTQIEMLADLSSGCISDAAKQLATKSITKQKLKMLSDADQSNRIDILKQSVSVERMRTEFSPIMKQKESWLFDSEPTLGESVSEMLCKKQKVARKPLIKKRQEPQMQSTEVVTMEPSKSNLSFKSGMTKLMEKRFPALNSQAIPEPSLAMEMKLKVSSMKSFKRNLMSMILDEKKCLCNKKINETHQDLSREKILNVASDAGSNWVRQSPENKKKCLITPMIEKNEGLKNLQVIPVVYEGTTIALAKEEDQPIANFSTSTDAGVKPLKLLYCTTSLANVNLNSLTMAQLKAMAKERKLTKYCKLKKGDLVKLLE